MNEARLRIEGPPDTLEALRRELIAGLGAEAEVEPISTAVPGELREPVLVGLMISFASTTAAVAIRTAGSIIERRMTHLERKELLKIYRERDDMEIQADDLFTRLFDDG